MKRLAAAVILCVAAACSPDLPETEAARPPSRARKAVAERADTCSRLPVYAARVRRGYRQGRSPDISFIPHRPNYVGGIRSPVHSGPWDFLMNVPLIIHAPVWVTPERVDRAATMADVAPTIARLIGFRMPERDGKALFDPIETQRRPRLVLTIVWDGGGWNALRYHSDRWPFLRRLLGRSVWFPQMNVASIPPITPPVHATLGTGLFPKAHGVVGLRLRTDEGRLVDPFLSVDPSDLLVPSLGDLYDAKRGNRPLVGLVASTSWHLGMVGHGAGVEGGDRDTVVLIDDEGVVRGNPSFYSTPVSGDPLRLQRWEQQVDAGDGVKDGAWRGSTLDNLLAENGNPARVRYDHWMLRRVIDAVGFGRDATPDLLFVNFKMADEAGHRWGMTSQRVGTVIAAMDRSLRRLVGWLNQRVGREGWALILTADHGQMPYPWESGAWAASGGGLAEDLNEAFDDNDNGVALTLKAISAGVYLNLEEVAELNVDLEDVGRWLVDYTVEDNSNGDIPEWWKGERSDRIFDAVVVQGRKVVSRCG
jgi:hypothetical protein